MRKRYIATILTAFGVVGYLAMDDSSSPTKVQNGNTQSSEPDFIIHGLSAENYGKDGKLSQQIDAITATHFPDTDTTVLTEPSVVVHKNELPRWGIRSNTGKLDSQQMLQLEGDILIVPMEEGNTLSLSTQELNIDLNKHVADTDKAVLIESDTTELQAIGMSLDLNTQQANFKSQVRGKHVPDAQ